MKIFMRGFSPTRRVTCDYPRLKFPMQSSPTSLIGDPSLFYAGCRPRATRSFCFGKRTQNHFRPCASPPILLRSKLSGGPPPTHRIKMAQKLAPLKQTSPKKSIRRSGSAAPNADTKYKILFFKLAIKRAISTTTQLFMLATNS